MKIDCLKANRGGLSLKVRIEKQSKLVEEHAQFNIHEYEFYSSVVGRHRNVTAAAGIERWETMKTRKIKPNYIIYSVPRIDLNN